MQLSQEQVLLHLSLIDGIGPATISFSNNPPSKIFSDPQEPNPTPLTFRTAIPPMSSYLSLKLLNRKTELDISAEKRLVEEAGTIGLTQTGLSKSTAEKIARCSVAALYDVYSSRSASTGIKTVGKTLVSELLLDEVENYLSIIPFPNMEDNVLFQSGKLVTKGIARHYLDKKLANVGNWYPTDFNIPDNEEIEWEDLVEPTRGLLTLLIKEASTNFIAEKLVKTTGKNTYLSVDKLPLITANDVAAATVTGITSHAFQNHEPNQTAKLIGKKFTINKMTAVELGLFKKYWHSGVKNHRAIIAINKWIHHHQKIISLSQNLLEEFVIPPINKYLLGQLLRSISQSSNE